MSLPPRILLHSPVSNDLVLAQFVEECLKDCVRLIAIAGEDADKLELQVDTLVVGDGSDKSRFLFTSAHPNEPLSDVRDFASEWFCDRDGFLEVRL
ncbi:putative metal-binding protein [Sphingobium sp. B1D7B]|uniref:hypothetical protein n=1 Tax=unclassified Sphingobium TaxID=2611147 RepID=UPI00222513C6|nr:MULTISPECIES: hypothetical protein [unclassified Sphingobium]MCW2392716.1 putative metal-binding protein [Sphingobium sp. B11D3A]MCW2404449.1 putative metal-binding protein [Sphingobium sp. B1D7B]